MLEALCQGSNDPVALAELARGRLRSKLPALRAGIGEPLRDHHAFLVSQILAHLDYLDEAIAACSARIAEQIAPFAPALRLVFPSSRHLASWAKLSPGNNESAGKRKSGSTGRGSPWLRSTRRVGTRRHPHPRLPAREVLADPATTRPPARRDRGRTRDPRDRLPDDQHR
jgi:transposase